MDGAPKTPVDACISSLIAQGVMGEADSRRAEEARATMEAGELLNGRRSRDALTQEETDAPPEEFAGDGMAAGNPDPGFEFCQFGLDPVIVIQAGDFISQVLASAHRHRLGLGLHAVDAPLGVLEAEQHFIDVVAVDVLAGG